MKRKDAEHPAGLGSAEGGSFAFAEGAQFAGAALDDVARHLIGERDSLRARAPRIGENMQIGERKSFDEGESGGVVVFRFTRKTGDDVGTDGGVREAFVDEFDAARVMLSAIPAVHGRKDAV